MKKSIEWVIQYPGMDQFEDVIPLIQADALRHGAEICESLGTSFTKQMLKNGAFNCRVRLNEEADKLEAK